ncbi:hypothetical protein ACFLXT_03715 [Chloroflexota bacterium]
MIPIYSDYFNEVFLSKAYPVRAALDHMKERQKGKFVFITSDAGMVSTMVGLMHGALTAALLFATRVWARGSTRW